MNNQMNSKFNISFDLGSDSLKVAFAYANNNKYVVGKISASDSCLSVAIPSLAYYDSFEKKWLFGEDVIKNTDASFTNTVKIKELLSFLSSDNNRIYYAQKCDFPKFYFPRKQGLLDDFGASVEKGYSFNVPGCTPRDVCEQFFSYIKRIVDEQICQLKKVRNLSFNTQNPVIALVYPPKSGDDYIEEYQRLVTKAFGISFSKKDKLLSSTKAIAMCAAHRGYISDDDELLVFDMGDEDLSVAKASLVNGQVCVDCAKDHMGPVAIGGSNIDNDVAGYILTGKRLRETMGTASAGEEGHIYEDILLSKEYLLMNNVKNAKIYLSYFADKKGIVAENAPIGVEASLYLPGNLSRKEFMALIGTDGKNENAIAPLVLKYICDELSIKYNRKMTTKGNRKDGVGYVLLSGGLVKTYSLFKYLKDNVEKKYTVNGKKRIEVITLDKFSNDEKDSVRTDAFSVYPHESASFTPAIGGALVALYDDEIATVFTSSYATFFEKELYDYDEYSFYTRRSEPNPKDKRRALKGMLEMRHIMTCAQIMVDRGTPVENFSSSAFFEIKADTCKVENDKIFKTSMRQSDIMSAEAAKNLEDFKRFSGKYYGESIAFYHSPKKKENEKDRWLLSYNHVMENRDILEEVVRDNKDDKDNKNITVSSLRKLINEIHALNGLVVYSEKEDKYIAQRSEINNAGRERYSTIATIPPCLVKKARDIVDKAFPIQPGEPVDVKKDRSRMCYVLRAIVDIYNNESYKPMALKANELHFNKLKKELQPAELSADKIDDIIDRVDVISDEIECTYTPKKKNENYGKQICNIKLHVGNDIVDIKTIPCYQHFRTDREGNLITSYALADDWLDKKFCLTLIAKDGRTLRVEKVSGREIQVGEEHVIEDEHED